MTDARDERIARYLRWRTQSDAPDDIVRSVMRAVAAAPPKRAPLMRYLPAFAVTGAAGLVVALVLLVQLTGVGQSDGSSTTPGELREAVAEASAALTDGPGFRGVHVSEIRDVVASAVWFDHRPNGDRVVVRRRDVDVAETGWWLDPDAEPPAIGSNLETSINVIAGDGSYSATRTTGGWGEGWSVAPRAEAPETLPLAVHLVLDGFEPALDGLSADDSTVTRADRPDGGTLWRLAVWYRGGRAVGEWRIGPDGVLESYGVDFTDVAALPYASDSGVTSVHVEFELLAAPDPIRAPDTDAAPDPATFGFPEELPLDP